MRLWVRGYDAEQRHAHELRDDVGILIEDHWRGVGDCESLSLSRGSLKTAFIKQVDLSCRKQRIRLFILTCFGILSFCRIFLTGGNGENRAFASVLSVFSC
jgi:hypothetical protein